MVIGHAGEPGRTIHIGGCMSAVWRQGDGLIIATDEPLSADAQRVPPGNGRMVLANGEATGHADALRDRQVKRSALTGAEVEDRFLVIVGARRQWKHTPGAPVWVAD